MNSIYDTPKTDDPATELPFFTSQAACGFPSPADDHMDGSLDLNQHLIKHPAATFFVRASGESMCDIGILDGDLLIVDKSLTPKDNCIVIAVINGEFTVKRLKIINGKGFLYPANKKYQATAIADLEGLQFWGVITHAIHDVRTS
jgi:DNA polymerase V